MGFSRQEHWSGLPFPSPGDLPDPEIEPGSPTLQADALPSEPPGKSKLSVKVSVNKNVLLSSYQIQRPLNSIHKLQVKNFWPTVEIRERYMVFGFPQSRNREKKLCITEWRRQDRQEKPPDFSSGKDDHDTYQYPPSESGLREMALDLEGKVKVAQSSLRSHGLYSPWSSPGQNPGVSSHSLLQGIFPTQGSNPGLPHSRKILNQLSHHGSHLDLDAGPINGV